MIRVGLIGTGIISGFHLSYLKTRKDVAIAALCCTNKRKLERRRKEFGGEAFTDFRRMLEQVELDAVWLCTPPRVRRGPLLACADLGIPVMCEKPVELNLRRAKMIARELKKRKARVQVGYVLRTAPIVERLRKEMAGDKIHLVKSFYGCDVGLTRQLPAWFYDKKRSGGALIDQATHDLDLLRMLVGEVVEVRGVASNPVQRKKKGYTIDEALALSFVFKNGAVGSHVHTWVGDAWRNEMFFVGEKRAYRLDLWRGVLTIEEGKKRRQFRQDQGRLYWHQNARFLQMVKSGNWRRNPCDYEEGVATLKLALACDRAVSL